MFSKGKKERKILPPASKLGSGKMRIQSLVLEWEQCFQDSLNMTKLAASISLISAFIFITQMDILGTRV